MQTHYTLQEIDQFTNQIRNRTTHHPKIAIVLGSGLGALADSVQNADIFSYSEIPEFPFSTVRGHTGRFVIGTLEDKEVIIMNGRVHFYEGYDMAQVTLPVRVMQRLGVETLILTNAAGAIDPNYVPGDLMLITDHISMLGLTGSNPLMGPNLDELGPRFPDMSRVYDRDLMDLTRRVAVEKGVPLREGVYVGLSGPSFETPAELRFLRAVGSDAVGMSTVAEATVARHGGLRVLGISGISNKANLDGNTPTSHDEVLDAGKVLTPRLETLLRGVLRKI
jgi:purine-nucleoside phosphorylase